MKKDSDFLKNYFDEYKALSFEENIYPELIAFKELCEEIKLNKKKLMFGGNGASASTSSHGAVDFTKQAGVRSTTFNEAGLITAFSNDFGYEHWLAKAIEHYGDKGDAVVLISVSGTSENIVEAAHYAKKHGYPLVTFSGKSQDNPLRKLGDINFFVNSKSYNIVEGIHMMWLTTVVDLVIGKSEYTTQARQEYLIPRV